MTVRKTPRSYRSLPVLQYILLLYTHTFKTESQQNGYIKTRVLENTIGLDNPHSKIRYIESVYIFSINLLYLLICSVEIDESINVCRFASRYISMYNSKKCLNNWNLSF